MKLPLFFVFLWVVYKVKVHVEYEKCQNHQRFLMLFQAVDCKLFRT